eukprot:CAMPEP_0170527736 /NCGR_PEP_ID=MMETSP0209-20121228/13209_1 /TAXON_ID=665100 ORGANISM="Litonotus pictus, Strain P1" /NCGR_SAMPLE_ID=MMETSP0209 /ASSEMBLY_ACC=CAM_ASM_000301 /LENGTH=235 /DNA_ID=CAMNT_0010818467 /DNA_START=39 /DNA_END=746 /DNA_ORIENTATION=+
MPGYTGMVPKIQREEKVTKIDYTKHIPGYRGYIQSVKAENKFGESYGKLTNKALTGQIEKGSDLPPHSRYTSTTRENFINQRNVKIQSTAELLGVSSRKDVYKKPVPIDTINKFWGLDSKVLRHDEVIQKQSFDQSYKNFWSFVDSNELDYEERVSDSYDKSVNNFWGVEKGVQEAYPDLKFKPIPGYQGENRSIKSENIFGLTYENARGKADDLLNQINSDRAQQIMKSSRMSK